MFAKILAIILFIAGLLHGVKPELFLVAMPPYIPSHLEIIFLTGVLEFALAAGLYFPHSRKRTALISCLYFIAILPAHIHVSLNQIPMFGVSSALLLWGRTLFQSVFIGWSYSIYKSR